MGGVRRSLLICGSPLLSLHPFLPLTLTNECSLSTLPVAALDWVEGGDGAPGVSQAINTTFHAPAPLYVPTLPLPCLVVLVLTHVTSSSHIPSFQRSQAPNRQHQPHDGPEGSVLSRRGELFSRPCLLRGRATSTVIDAFVRLAQIYDKTNSRLVATAVQTKMRPSRL